MIISKNDERILVENPYRHKYESGKFSNINFLEVIQFSNRKEYLSHSNSGMRVITQLQAEIMLSSWKVII